VVIQVNSFVVSRTAFSFLYLLKLSDTFTGFFIFLQIIFYEEGTAAFDHSIRAQLELMLLYGLWHTNFLYFPFRNNISSSLRLQGSGFEFRRCIYDVSYAFKVWKGTCLVCFEEMEGKGEGGDKALRLNIQQQIAHENDYDDRHLTTA
jgi:hypothetical protein